MFGTIINVILDPIFIYKNLKISGFEITGLGLGVSGAAWATIFSLGLSSIIMFYYL